MWVAIKEHSYDVFIEILRMLTHANNMIIIHNETPIQIRIAIRTGNQTVIHTLFSLRSVNR